MVLEKTGIDNVSLNKVTKAGLTLVSLFTGEKFSFETGKSGEISELNYDSRLLAFSIPTNIGPIRASAEAHRANFMVG